MNKRGRPVIYESDINKSIRKPQNSKKELKGISFDVFKGWYLLQNNCCVYCRLTKFESKKICILYPE